MSGAAIVRIKKLTDSGIIGKAARHNKRTIQAEIGASASIDPTRSHLNETLVGPLTPDAVAQLAKDLMAAAGITTLRKDAVLGLELVFSLPVAHGLNERDYFMACTAWAGDYFGGAKNVLSADLHRDEAQHHCHVLILPLVDGRMNGGKLMGYSKTLMTMQQSFFDAVASIYGLHKAPAKLSGLTRQAAAKTVLQTLSAGADAALKSKVWASIRDAIERDPVPYLQALGVDTPAPAKRMRTMAEIFTSKGKGNQKEPISIDFGSTPKGRSLCSVEFPQKASSPATTKPDPSAEPLEVVRVRESDLASSLFNPETGEYFQRPPKPELRQKQAAQKWVANALDAHRVDSRPVRARGV
jgi:hypothetical protein